MIGECKANFKNKFKGKSIICSSCKGNKNIDSQNHVLQDCSTYSDLREDTDFDNDDELVEFFRKVKERRAKEDDNS